jgi:hypothetical protein
MKLVRERFYKLKCEIKSQTKKQTNSVALSPQAKFID